MDSSNVLIKVMIITIITLTLETIMPAFSIMITSLAWHGYLTYVAWW